jgi:hypothetical protein
MGKSMGFSGVHGDFMEFHRKIHGMKIIENPLQWDILGYILWSSNMAIENSRLK